MAFDPNSPAESHAVLSGDINQIRENDVQLRKNESGASAPSNLVAGMLWYDTNGPYLKIRRADNGGWYYIYLGTQACVEAGLTVTPAQLNDVINKALKGANADITSMIGLNDSGIPLAKVAGTGALAASGANSDITSLAGLTTPLSAAQGGTGGTGGAVQMKTGTYTGDGQDNRNVNIGIDLAAATYKWMMTGCSATAYNKMHKYGHVSGDLTEYFEAAAAIADVIQAWTATGFQLGTNAIANNNTTVYNYMVIYQI